MDDAVTTKNKPAGLMMLPGLGVVWRSSGCLCRWWVVCRGGVWVGRWRAVPVPTPQASGWKRQQFSNVQQAQAQAKQTDMAKR